jgi:hypothetical protein
LVLGGGRGDTSVIDQLVSSETRVDLASSADTGDLVGSWNGGTILSLLSTFHRLLASSTGFQIGFRVDTLPSRCFPTEPEHPGGTHLEPVGTSFALEFTLDGGAGLTGGGGGDTGGTTCLLVGRAGEGTGGTGGRDGTGRVDTRGSLLVQTACDRARDGADSLSTGQLVGPKVGLEVGLVDLTTVHGESGVDIGSGGGGEDTVGVTVTVDGSDVLKGWQEVSVVDRTNGR